MNTNVIRLVGPVGGAKESAQAARRPRPIDVEIGARIRVLRRIKDHSQEKLAGKIGVSFQSLQKTESGKNRLTVSRLIDICAAMGADPVLFVSEITPGHVASDATSETQQALALLSVSGAHEVIALWATLDRHDKAALKHILNGMAAKNG